MAHEITQTDRFVGYKTGGWHGLGKVFQERVRTAEDAIRMSELGWDVVQLRRGCGNAGMSRLVKWCKTVA